MVIRLHKYGNKQKMVNVGLVDTIKQLVIKVFKQTRGYKKLQVFGGIEALDEVVTFFYYWSLHGCKGKKFDMQFQRKNHLET